MAKYETSTRYHWPAGDAGLVDAVEIVRQKNGRSVAYLHAKEAPEFKPQRTEARAAIRARGWGTLSDFRDGQHVLRVSGLRDATELLDLLRETGCTQGAPSVSTSRAAQIDEARTGVIGFIRDHSLTISGVLATIGNALSITQGVLRSIESQRREGKQAKIDTGQIGMGLAFAAADLPLAIAGERDDGRQFSNLLRHLKKHFAQNGINIPASASIYVETSDADKSVGELMRDYLHRYANQIKCGLEVVASGFSIKAGLAQGNKGKIAAGAIFGPGFLASLLIPEKKIDEEKYAAAGPLGRFWMRVQSNPLSIGGLLGYSNTVLTYASGYDEMQRFKGLRPAKLNKAGEMIQPSKYYPMDFTIPSIMIGANGTYAISKKTVGGDIRNEAMERDIYSIASQILNKQPANRREEAFESTVNFLADRPEVRGNRDEVRAQLRETMTKQAQNPWFEPVALPPSSKAARTASKLESPAPTTPQLAVGEVTHVAKGVDAANHDQALATATAR